MGEGLKQMFDEIQFSYRAEDEDDLGENTDSGAETDGSCSTPSPRKQIHRSAVPSRLDSEGPLHDLSSLVDQLPLKKGLSKYYKGKSQSFTSLSEVKTLEDLPKKGMVTDMEVPKKIKPCKSYAALDQAQVFIYPSLETSIKSTSKKTASSMISCTSSVARSRSNRFLGRGSRPPPVPVQHKHQ